MSEQSENLRSYNCRRWTGKVWGMWQKGTIMCDNTGSGVSLIIDMGEPHYSTLFVFSGTEQELAQNGVSEFTILPLEPTTKEEAEKEMSEDELTPDSIWEEMMTNTDVAGDEAIELIRQYGEQQAKKAWEAGIKAYEMALIEDSKYDYESATLLKAIPPFKMEGEDGNI